MAKVFISHSSQDQTFAEELASELRRNGHEALGDVQGLRVSPDWDTQLLNALADSDFVVFLFTKHARGSEYILAEVGAAKALYNRVKAPRLIPVVIPGGALPEPLSRVWAQKLPTQPTAQDLCGRIVSLIANHPPVIDSGHSDLVTGNTANAAIGADGKNKTLKERIEAHAVIFFLGALVAGFTAGIGVYKGILEIAHLKTVSEAHLVELEKARSANNVSSEDWNALGAINSAIDRLAFRNHSPIDEDLRAMFLACEDARFTIQRNRGRIRSSTIGNLLDTLDGDFAHIRSISPWHDTVGSLTQPDFQRQAKDRADLYKWAKAERTRIEPLEQQNNTSDAFNALFLEVRKSQERVAGIVEAARRLAGTLTPTSTSPASPVP